MEHVAGMEATWPWRDGAGTGGVAGAAACATITSTCSRASCLPAACATIMSTTTCSRASCSRALFPSLHCRKFNSRVRWLRPAEGGDDILAWSLRRSAVRVPWEADRRMHWDGIHGEHGSSFDRDELAFASSEAQVRDLQQHTTARRQSDAR